eukprot:8052532-Prorocentrum_lima.AAC.1
MKASAIGSAGASSLGEESKPSREQSRTGARNGESVEIRKAAVALATEDHDEQTEPSNDTSTQATRLEMPSGDPPAQ